MVESYGWARTEEAIKTGRMGSKKRGDLRKSDRWFLEYSGIGEVLKKHDVEFLNIIEENWRRRTVDPEVIKEAVESKYPPVAMEEFYGFVPERIYDLRGGDLLSLAKVKLWLDPIVVSFAVKNFFGMIPDPSRGRYHGKKNSRLNRSIVDIYKVYDSLFNIKGVVEAVFTASVVQQTGKTTIHENPGFASGSKNPLELDAFVTALVRKDPQGVGHLKLAAQVFGKWDDENIKRGLEAGISIF